MENQNEDSNEDMNLLIDEEERDPKHKDKWQTFIGVLLSQIFCILIVASGVSVQLLQKAIPDFELNTFRNTLPLFTFAIYFSVRRSLPSVPRDQWRLLVGLCLSTTVGVAMLFIGLALVPAGTGTAIQSVATLVIGIFLFRCFLDEKFKCLTIVSVLCCVVGIILILQPYNVYLEDPQPITDNNNTVRYGNITHFEFMNQTRNHKEPQESDGMESLIGYIIMAGSGVGLTFITLFNVKICQALDVDVYIWNIVFWLYFVQFWLSLIVCLVTETPVMPQSGLQWFYVFLHSVTYCMVWPVRMASNARLDGNGFNILFSATLVYMALCQYTILKDILPGYANWQEVLGILIVALACVIKFLKV